MTNKLEKLPNEPIVILSYVDYNYETDGSPVMAQLEKVLDEQSEPVFYIINVLEARVNFEDLTRAANLAAKQFNIHHHPNMRESLIVTQDQMVRLGAKGMDSEVYGKITFKIFETVDEALAYARS